ncbi:Fasciclin-like arabinogalactan family protein [Abeliophyllum distichum]|uniref:Fasciclin-like arabinogalactan family protein n=1 Tax=Abeliophyllum distichum TaxID=126358 RepID=A0ABD1QEY2_9LAMI
MATTGLRLISAAKPIRPPYPYSIPLPQPGFPPTSYPPPSPILLPLSPPPLLPPAEIQKQQLNNIIDALIGAGDFAEWINLLSSTNSSSMPLTATLFVPSNDAISQFPSTTAAGMNFDPFIVPYHIVPQRLSFSDLQQFPTLTHLPTLFPSKYIVITNNSRFNFSLDDSLVTHPDILVNAAFSVHGINNVLDYNAYGGNGLFSPPQPPDKTTASMPKPILSPLLPNDTKPVVPPRFPEEETIIDVSFGVACLCNAFLIIFSVVCAVFVSKIQ